MNEGDHPRVSVVMPCFNAAPYLEKALESILAQTFTDWECIVFDDGSTDESLTKIERVTRLDPRIRLIESPHVGIVAALQAACAEAHGAFIARMDADDVAHPDRLALQLDLMTREPGMALCGAGVEVFGPNVGEGRRRYESWINGLVTHQDLARELFVECPIPHPTFFMRSADYREAGGYREAGPGWPEDYDLCMQFWLAGKRLGKVAGPLLRWRDAEGRLSMSDARYGLDRFRAVKRHYLFESYLKDKRFIQWGAGEVGKLWLREWGERRPEAVVDINPRKIGRVIHGFPVIAPEDLPGPGETFVIVAVGAPGARDEIREWFAPRGYVETADYLFVA